MTARRTWKRRESEVADFFPGVRNPLSGRNSKHTAADVVHERLFIECKLSRKHSVVNLWDETKALADKEGKAPVVVLCEKNRRGFWIMVHSEDFLKI